MQAYTVAMTAGFLGWFVCSLFASVAYNWTFYYLLALIVASREMVTDADPGRRARLLPTRGKSFPFRAPGFPDRSRQGACDRPLCATDDDSLPDQLGILVAVVTRRDAAEVRDA